MPIAFAAALSLGGLPALAKSTKHHHAESASAKHGKSAKASKIASTKAKAAHGKHARAEQAAEDRREAKAVVIEPTGSIKSLSASDARAYAAAFQAIRQGDFDEADRLAKRIDDRLLMGRLRYAKLMHPDYTASYDELKDWLDDYHDQPDANRVYTLAYKRRPQNAPAPATPDPELASSADPIAARAETMARRIEATIDTPSAPIGPPPAAPTAKVDPKVQKARESFYAGEVAEAHKLAVKVGERWIAGLAAYRLNKFEDAQRWLSQLASDQSENEWVRSGAAYWAARAAIASGKPEDAPAYLQLAARTPYTFYGLIAERQLGLESSVAAPPAEATTASSAAKARASTVAGAGGAGVAKLLRSDRRARRAAAFAQIGMKAEAGLELRTALQGASGEARGKWTGLALALNAPLTSPADLTRGGRSRFDLAQYPTPDLEPAGGFTVDKALVYALVRQESRFNPDANSTSGAYGLMQLMPETAARVAGDDKLKKDPSPLRDPSVNLQLGQAYVTKLLGAVKGDILQAVASYNIGPGVITKTAAKMGAEVDSLLLIESMPGGQTREYVEKVMAGYWIYRQIFGQDSPTLSAVASGTKAVAAALDH